MSDKTLPRKIAIYLFNHGYTIKSFCAKTGMAEKDIKYLLNSANFDRKRYGDLVNAFILAAGEGLNEQTLLEIDKENDEKEVGARYKELKGMEGLTAENCASLLNPYDQIIYEGYPRKMFKNYSYLDHIRTVGDITSEDLKSCQDTITALKKEEQFDEKMRKQRYKKGYADVDAWNICSWFIDIMPRMLTEMRDNLHGYPASVSPAMLNSQAVVLDDGDKKEPGFIEWQKTLSRMIFLLQEMDEDKCSFKNPYQEEYYKASKDFEKKYGFLGCDFEKINGIEADNTNGKRVYFFSDDPDHPEWKDLASNYRQYEIIISNYRDRCREEFFNLFSQNFWDLWD